MTTKLLVATVFVTSTYVGLIGTLADDVETKRRLRNTLRASRQGRLKVPLLIQDDEDGGSFRDGRQGRAIADIRFNKCPPVIERDYVKGIHENIFPLTSSDYPLNGQKASILKRETMADSVVVPDDIQMKDFNVSTYWLNDETIDPVYPGDVEGRYWDQLRVVVEAQIARQSGALPATLNKWPEIWSEMTTLDDIAEAVHGEYPALHQQAFIQSLFDEGIEMYRDMGPFRSVVDFIGKEIRVASINTWAFEVVAPVNFMLKWHIGMPRPEEVAWMIYNDEITTLEDGVPEDLVSLIKSMNMQQATDFTAYYNGSPMHPSFPAMHSAGSTCSFWLPVLSKITPEQFCEALRVDYAVSYARTVAGVHYPQDNLAGLNIGQRIMREALPSMLEERYGYDSSMVASKLEALSFDWNTFDSETCTIGGVSSADFLRKAGR